MVVVIFYSLLNTIINDNPRLTCGLDGAPRQPIRVVLDTTLQINSTYNVIKNTDTKTIIITGSKYNSKNAEILQQYSHVELIHLNTPVINLPVALHELGKRNITSILVEGGQKVHNSFIDSQLFNEIVIYIAPKLIGGADAPAFFNGIGFDKLEQALQLKFTEVKCMGTDIKIIATR